MQEHLKSGAKEEEKEKEKKDKEEEEISTVESGENYGDVDASTDRNATASLKEQVRFWQEETASCHKDIRDLLEYVEQTEASWREKVGRYEDALKRIGAGDGGGGRPNARDNNSNYH